MAKKQHFLTQKDINKIIQKYGGGHRYKRYNDFTSHDCIFYKATDGTTLSINERYEPDTNEQFVEVHISDSKGKIIRKDRYGIWFDTREVRFDYTEENGEYTYEFKKVGETMARNKRQTENQRLRERVKQLEDIVKLQSEQNQRIVNAAEDSYMNSPTYRQMLQKVEWFKKLCSMNEDANARVKKQVRSADDTLRQVYEDNKSMLSKHTDDREYWIGITDNWHEASEYKKLKDENIRLEAKVEQQKEAIGFRDEEIKRLQLVIAEMECESKNGQTTTAPTGEPIIEEPARDYEEEIKQIRKDSDRWRKDYSRLNEKYKGMLNNKFDSIKLNQVVSSQKALIEDLQKQIADMTATLPLQESVKVIEQNIEQKKELKKVTSPKGGRPTQINDRKVETIMELRKNNVSMRDIADQLGISVGSVHRIIKMNSNNR